MSGFEIGAEYIKALAWPAVVFGFYFVFRTPLRDLIGRLRSVQTPAGSAHFFDQRAAEVKEEAADAAAEVTKAQVTLEAEAKATATADATVTPSSEEDGVGAPIGASSVYGPSTFGQSKQDEALIPVELVRAWTAPEFGANRDIASIDPAAAVMATWRRVEQFIHVVLRSNDINAPWSRPVIMMEQLQRLGLERHFVDVAHNLRLLRNQVAHGPTRVSVQGALDYIEAAERLSDALLMLMK